jgi:hypothetical protein
MSIFPGGATWIRPATSRTRPHLPRHGHEPAGRRNRRVKSKIANRRWREPAKDSARRLRCFSSFELCHSFVIRASSFFHDVIILSVGGRAFHLAFPKLAGEDARLPHRSADWTDSSYGELEAGAPACPLILLDNRYKFIASSHGWRYKGRAWMKSTKKRWVKPAVKSVPIFFECTCYAGAI